MHKALSYNNTQVPESVKFFIDIDKARTNSSVIDKAIDDLFSTTQMEDVNYRIKLFEEAALEELKGSDEPIMKLAINLNSRYKHFLTPLYIQALRAFKPSKGEILAPDANSSLRITFGRIRGYLRMTYEEKKNEEYQ